MDFLRSLFFDHWQRKLISLMLTAALWILVNESLTTTKTLENIAVRLINIPEGMTVDGLLPNNMLLNRIPLTLYGNKNILKDLTSNDLEVVLDATDKSDEWTAMISSKNLVSLNPDVDLSKAIKRILNQRFSVSFTRLVTEKIPIIVTHPIGEAPRDYQFLDVWPYRLSITVSGPEEKIKQIKAKGVNLTFNLNDITRMNLDEATTTSDEVSFIVPNAWKEIILPSISDRPLVIDDPQAQELRIDFVKSDFHAIAKPIPIALFFPIEHSHYLNPDMYSIATSGLIERVHGIYMIRGPLFIKGASRLFVELVQEMLQISILVHPKQHKLDWCVQCQNHRVIEDKYVSVLLSDEELRYEDPNFSKQREEYLRNRFRSYMNRFQIFKSQTEKLNLAIELDHKHICIQDVSSEKVAAH
ncbi:YbbR-like domain-containing protein [Rhabdochlamydiaceae symbiont of Dictyostelium giganteum]|uniref:CdaR family protein n=1 Tax=Rhabdochlamydiaceae symbiont of Dictyostelium giganteum TaxID=3342349 RepID=UPI00384E7C52